MHLDELQQAIRFAISQLSALNGQMDFEKICLHFSRARIHKNILPATGPVQAGGDQGRDFETFHSYLATSPIGKSSFVGLFSENPVAFACSLEKEPAQKKGKIYADVKTIMTSGSKVERIYFFSGEDIPVGKRHMMQEVVKNEFKTELEIIDAQALSQHLADQDLFWIAIQYLKIPSAYYPKVEEENWYSKLLKEYQERNESPKTFEEFSDIKGAIRHIYKKVELKRDLPFWLEKLDLIINESSFPAYLVRKAIYEKFVTSLVGLDNVEGQEANIEKYYQGFEVYTAVSDLQDAQMLLSFLWNSMHLGRHQLTKEYLSDIATRLDNLLKTKIKRGENVDTKSALIEVYASFLFHDQRTNKDFSLHIKRYVSKLKEMIPLLRRTHFFSISSFADTLNKKIEILLDTPIDPSEIEIFARQIDEILSKKANIEVVGEKLRNRAQTYIDKKLYFKAIETLHELKIKWFNKDTLKGSILTCLLLADTYRKLNLFFAAKYYAFVASYLAINSKEVDYSPQFLEGLSIAADSDYASGSWFSFINLMDLLVLSQYKMTKDFDVFDHQDTPKIIFYPAIVLESASLFLPAAVSFFNSVINKWGFIKDEIQSQQERFRKGFDIEKIDEFKKHLLNEIPGMPFNDAGQTRIVSFNAWGCNWNFKFKNDFLTNGIAEEFIATFQIILADLTEVELYIISSNINIEIKFKKHGEAEFKQLPSNAERLWQLELSSYAGSTFEELNKHQFTYLVIAQALIYEISLLPIKEWKKIIGQKITEENLVSKASFARPYESLYHHFVSESNFKKEGSRIYNIGAAFDPYTPKENEKLLWKNSVAEKYKLSQSIKDIQNRVDTLKGVLSISLATLNTNKEFKKIVSKLRKAGWLDWQILHVTGTIVVNFKAQFKSVPSDKESMQQFSNIFYKDEKEWFKPIPPDLLTYERIKRELEVIFVATLLPSFGLEFHSETPNGLGIVHLLKERFNFFEDGKDIQIFNTV